MTDNTENVVLVEQRDRILIITINRPEAKNAVNAAVSRGLADAVDRLDSDPGSPSASSPAQAARSVRAWTSRRSPAERTS